MEHAAQTAVPPGYVQAVGVGFAVVDYDWFVQLQGQFQLSYEHIVHNFLVLSVPVVVQADLAYRHAFGVRGQLPDHGRGVHVPALPLLRLPADGCVDEGIPLGQSQRRPGAGLVAAGVYDIVYAQRRHGGEHLVTVGVELGAVVVRVRIDKHLLTSCALNHRFSDSASCRIDIGDLLC